MPITAPQFASLCRLGKKLTLLPILYRFVSGHDFSRADKADKMTWASVPAVRSSGKLLTKWPFSVASLAPEGAPKQDHDPRLTELGRGPLDRDTRRAVNLRDVLHVAQAFFARRLRLEIVLDAVRKVFRFGLKL